MKRELFFREPVIFSIAVVFDNVIHVFIAASAAADKDRTGLHLFRQLHCIGDCMRGFQRGNDAFIAGELEKRVDRFFIACGDVVDPAEVFPECVFGPDGGVVETAGNRIDRVRIAVFIFQHIAVESVQSPFFTE